MSVTQAQLESIVLGVLREEGFSSAYSQSLIDLQLDAAQQDINAGRVVHPYTGEEATKGDLHYLNGDAFYNNLQGTYLSVAANIGDVVLNVPDTTIYPSSGTLYLGGQIVTYTGKTPTTFTGVTPLLFGFIAGTQVSIAFALPADFSSIKNVIYNNKIKLPAKQYDDMFEDLNNYKGSNFQRNRVTSIYESPYKVKPFYTIKDAQYLIIYQLNETGVPIHLRYEKSTPAMSGTQGPIIDNDIYAKTTIPYVAVAEMMFDRGEEERAGRLYSRAIKNVKKMYSRYQDTTYESQNNVNYSMGKGKLNI